MYENIDSISDFFDLVCTKNTDKLALCFDESSYTYNTLYLNVYTISENLLEMGIGQGSKVAIILPNCVEYIFIYFALFRIGAIAIPFNTKWELDDVDHVLSDANVDAVIYKQVIGVINYYKIINTLVEKNNFKFMRFEIDEKNSAGSIGFNTLYQEKKSFCKIKNKRNDIAMISYTSGTTGIPKGVVMLNYNLLQTSILTGKILFQKGDSPLSIAPLYAAQGFLSLLMQFSCEGYMSYLSTFNPNEILKRVSAKKNNILHTQPTMWNLLLQSKLIDFTDFSGLNKVIVSGSLCAPDLARRIEERIGCKLINVYGLIEATSTVTTTRCDDKDDIRYNTVGRPIDGVSIKIVDDCRNEVGKGEVGELAVKGYIMLEYYKNSVDTQKVLEEGWLYTGDLARYYDNDNISIVGRKKDMIIRGGFNVYPIDIENYLLKHPKVMDVAVVGKKHDIIGEIIIAFVIAKPYEELTKAELYRYCQGRISNYKIPDEIYFINEMPIILSGKVDKKVLRKWADSGECHDGGKGW